ncbi:ankyrin repeat-containing domain protein [Baffinella frigidus]|nr:ankyrin repeat-containing domain protein [Cryptophyta sp. CCMP2293]
MRKRGGELLWQAVDGKSLPQTELYVANSDVNHRGWEFGHTPLHRAVERRFPEAVRLLLEHKADINAPDDWGLRPLHLAAMTHDEGSKSMVRFLVLQGAEVDATNNSGKTPLHHSVRFVALRPTHGSAMEGLIASGADVDARDKHNHTPLICTRGHELAHAALILLQGGANANACDDAGETCLFIPRDGAITYQTCSEEYAAMLLLHGCDVNTKNFEGDTPIHSACASTRDTQGWIRVLLDAGADVHAKNLQGDTPLHKAALLCAGSAVQLLLDRGAVTSARNSRGLMPANQPSRPLTSRPPRTHACNSSHVDWGASQFARTLINRENDRRALGGGGSGWWLRVVAPGGGSGW